MVLCVDVLGSIIEYGTLGQLDCRNIVNQKSVEITKTTKRGGESVVFVLKQ
jgi:hypothetical protein